MWTKHSLEKKKSVEEMILENGRIITLIGIEYLTYLNKDYQGMQMKFHIAIVNHSY